MAKESVPVIAELTHDECWKLLEEDGVGQIATALADRRTGQSTPDIFPINFHVFEQRILFRVTPGVTPLDLSTRPTVAFHAGGHDGDHHWSVTARGSARRMKFTSDVQESGILEIEPIQPGEQWNYVRIDVETITGVQFHGA